MRPASDLVCDTIGSVSGFRGDLSHIALTVGALVLWTFLAPAIAFALFATAVVIGRFKGSPQEVANAVP